MYKKLFVISLVVFTAIVQHGFGQQTREEIQQRQKELQQELNNLNSSLSDVRQSKKLSIRELDLLQQKIDARQSLIGSINNQLGDLDQSIINCNKQIDSCKKQLDTLKNKYAQSIVFAYKNRNSYNYISFLFAASSFNDAFRRIAYLKSYRQYRESQAASVVQAQAMLRQNIAKLENVKHEKNNALALQGNQLQDLQSDRNEKDSALNLLKGQEGTLTKEIAENAAKRKRLQTLLQAVIRREIEEAERKEREREARIAAAKKAEAERERIAAQQKAIEQRQEELAINNAANNTNAAKTKTTKQPQQNKALVKTQTAKPEQTQTAANSTSQPQTEPATKQRPEQQRQTADATPPANAVAVNTPADAARQNRSYNVLENTDESLTQSLDFEKNRGRLPWPVSGGFISEGYGVQTIPGTNLKEENDGVEISANGGSGVVKSVASGTVSAVVTDDGVSVIIRHGKYFTTYSNLSSANVNRGDNVNAGTIIGKMSSDGSSTMSMFFMVTDSKGNPLNPMSWIGSH